VKAWVSVAVEAWLDPTAPTNSPTKMNPMNPSTAIHAPRLRPRVMLPTISLRRAWFWSFSLAVLPSTRSRCPISSSTMEALM
jgi:hypothetical protein